MTTTTATINDLGSDGDDSKGVKSAAAAVDAVAVNIVTDVVVVVAAVIAAASVTARDDDKPRSVLPKTKHPATPWPPFGLVGLQTQLSQAPENTVDYTDSRQQHFIILSSLSLSS